MFSPISFYVLPYFFLGFGLAEKFPYHLQFYWIFYRWLVNSKLEALWSEIGDSIWKLYHNQRPVLYVRYWGFRQFIFKKIEILSEVIKSPKWSTKNVTKKKLRRISLFKVFVFNLNFSTNSHWTEKLFWIRIMLNTSRFWLRASMNS